MNRLSKSHHLSLVLALTLLSSILFGNGSASARTAIATATDQPAKAASPATDQVTSGTVVVTPTNMQGWFSITTRTTR